MPLEDSQFPLCQAFFEGARQEPSRFPASPRLEELLRTLWETGRNAWPGIELPPPHFARHLGARLTAGADEARLASVLAADLYLACACAAGNPEALRQFERHLLPVSAEAILRTGADQAWVDEVQQLLRQKLFVGSKDSPPKVGDYSGVGPLRSWVRAAAMRTATDLRRGEKHTVPYEQEQLEELDLLTADPELELLKSRHRRELKEAFAQAIASLSDREVTVLRFYLVDGLNIDRIGQLYGTHRATAARWIAGARTRLLDETRRILGERLRLTNGELDSLIRLVRSNLDLSIVRHLKQRPTER
jgi:RNA polymerase sigma-70 factor (ECF subfamily)